jgi:aldehyde:ferredoxin oxidoreductase
VERVPRSVVEQYVGGRGVNVKMLYDRVGPEIAGLDPRNVLIFGAGPLVGTLAPGACRTRITTVSPLTGLIGDSSVGGHWGPELKYAGLDHVVVSGRAESPVYLSFVDGKSEIRDAEKIWGMNTREASETLKAMNGDPEAQALCIGPAGENLVRYACIVGDGYNVAGRTGVGAVMGSKNLKAVLVRGTGGVRVADTQSFEEAAREAHRLVQEHPQYRSLSEVGLMRGMLEGYHGEEELRSLNPQTFLDEYVYKRKTCFGCTAHCMYHFAVSEGLQAGCYSGNFPANPLIEFGSKLRIRDWPSILRLTELSTEYGLDVDGAGSTILFAVELAEAGLLDSGDVGGMKLGYGDYELCEELLRMITFREGLGDAMSKGSRQMAGLIGGDAVLHTREIKGLELMPGSLPHYYNAIAHAVSGRGGCHTRSQCFVAVRYVSPQEAEERFGTREAVELRATGGKARMLAYYEDLLAVGDEAGVCNFFTGESCSALGFDELSRLLGAATGMWSTPEALRMCGERAINLERLFNLRRGLTRADDTIPPRLVSGEEGEHDVIKRDLESMLDEYYRVRGWRRIDGIPEKETLERLMIRDNG